MKYKFLFLGIVLLVGILSFVISEEATPEVLDIGLLENLNFNLSGSGIDYALTETSSRKDTLVNFKEENSFLQVGNNKLENIVSSSEGFDSFVKLDKDGKIIEADFMTGSKEGSYTINGVEYKLPPNSRFYFDGKEKILEFKEGSQLKSFPVNKEGTGSSVKLFGENYKLPDGSTVSEGTLFYENGVLYVQGGESAIINSVEILSYDKLPIYLDGQKHSSVLNYVSFGGNEVYLAGNNNVGEVTFLSGNKYFPNMAADANVKMSLIEDGSEIHLIKYSTKDFPNIYAEGGYNIQSGQMSLTSKNDKLYYSPLDISTSSSAEMDIFTSSGEYKKTILVGDNSNFKCFVGEGVSNDAYLDARKDLDEDLTFRKNSFQGEKYKKEILAYVKQMEEPENILREALFNKKGCSFLETKSFSTNEEIDKYASTVTQNCFLTRNEIKSLLSNTKYLNYLEIKDAYSEAEGVIFSRVGTKETEEEYWGIRNAFYIYPKGN